MKTALLLIDIQNDYFPGGRMELEGSPEAAARSRLLLDLFRRHGWPTVHIRHISIRPGATFFLPETEGAEIHASIGPRPGEPVIEKHFPNSFRETTLLEHLKQVGAERLAIAGSMTHMCVDATVRAAADLGYPVLLAADACATRALKYGETTVPAAQVQAAFLAALKSYAQVLPADEILAQLQA
jgi:nicotinamidase-related amidase